MSVTLHVNEKAPIFTPPKWKRTFLKTKNKNKKTKKIVVALHVVRRELGNVLNVESSPSSHFTNNLGATCQIQGMAISGMLTIAGNVVSVRPHLFCFRNSCIVSSIRAVECPMLPSKLSVDGREVSRYCRSIFVPPSLFNDRNAFDHSNRRRSSISFLDA